MKLYGLFYKGWGRGLWDFMHEKCLLFMLQEKKPSIEISNFHLILLLP